ncbi:hypothetical protein HAX54_049172 [Datura stramonium]|uniref:Isopenicillin N synthase-like Fe(2+) 2OG dioxygenase domain-containing protein n=1 Tax=Datura stramonium TaxID=4076 RepID=A0ABS8WMN1_DATST|nr:hypothetical protein [Datura stramonium]
MLAHCGSIITAPPSSSASDNPGSTPGLQGTRFLPGTSRHVASNHVVNHGIPLSVMKDVLDAAAEFFDLPNEEKMHLLSPNVHDHRAYNASLNDLKDKGLQIMDRDEEWHSVPVIEGALIVLVGDHMEVLSNGRYKGAVHRATVNSEKKRLSIASLHSLALGKS